MADQRISVDSRLVRDLIRLVLLVGGCVAVIVGVALLWSAGWAVLVGGSLAVVFGILAEARTEPAKPEPATPPRPLAPSDTIVRRPGG